MPWLVCKTCGFNINFQEAHAGKTLACPKCKAMTAFPPIAEWEKQKQREKTNSTNLDWFIYAVEVMCAALCLLAGLDGNLHGSILGGAFLIGAGLVRIRIVLKEK